MSSQVLGFMRDIVKDVDVKDEACDGAAQDGDDERPDIQ